MADPVFTAVGVELIATALADAVRAVLGAVRGSGRRRAIERLLKADPAVYAAVEQMVSQIEAEDEADAAPAAESLHAFLRSAECRRALIPLFYGAPLEQASLDTVRAGFRVSLAHPPPLATLGEQLFDALAPAAERALQAAIAGDELWALDATAQLRHRLLQEELANIERKISLLAGDDAPTHEQIVDYCHEYRRQVVHRESTIVPPHLDRKVRHALDELYVPPHFNHPATSEVRGHEMPYEWLVSDLDRVVVLGDPGGGKTTLTKRIATDVCAAPVEDLTQVPPVAIGAILRDYGAEKQQPGWSLLRHIEATASSRYQLSSPPPGLFEYLLRNGLALVLLDGLDELLETARRREISDDVEAFAHLYPSAAVLVTSRRIGYYQAPLDTLRFEAFELAPFDSAQVRKYVASAFSLHCPAPVQKDDPLVNAFIAESATVPDLQGEPSDARVDVHALQRAGLDPLEPAIGDLREVRADAVRPPGSRSRAETPDALSGAGRAAAALHSPLDLHDRGASGRRHRATACAQGNRVSARSHVRRPR